MSWINKKIYFASLYTVLLAKQNFYRTLQTGS